MPHFERHVFICTNRRDAGNPKGCCASKGADKIRDAFKGQLFAANLHAQVRPNKSGCLDQCEHGVAVVVYPEQVWYGNVTLADVPEIIERHLKNGQVVERLLLPDQPHVAKLDRLPVLK